MEFTIGFVAGVFSGAPIWIWPLLGVLIILGLHCSREREMSILPYFLMPLIGLTNVPTLLAQESAALAFSAWILAYMCGIGCGFAVQGRWVLWRSGLKARVAGEWLSLSVMMLLFWANFFNGIFAAIAPEITAGQSYQILFPALLGLASGSFLGRPLRIALWPSQVVASV